MEDELIILENGIQLQNLRKWKTTQYFDKWKTDLNILSNGRQLQKFANGRQRQYFGK